MVDGVTVPQRAVVSPELLGALRQNYALSWDGQPVDLGGSNNLNLLLPRRNGGHVARVYRPWTTSIRLRAIQHARSSLVAAGLPCPPTVATVDGDTRLNVDGSEVEVERHVAGHSMNIGDALLHGMRMLGQVHSVLREVRVDLAGVTAPHPNHVETDRAWAGTYAGTATIRADRPSADELAAVDAAEALADELADADLEVTATLPRQLVHGDFWDNNVLFRDDAIVAILDLDFMGERARIDDVALTLYYTNSTLGPGYGSSERRHVLAQLLNAYDDGLEHKLTAAERTAVPFALARTVLCFVGMLPSIESRQQRRTLVQEIHPDLQWSLDIVRTAQRWQSTFT